MGVFSVVSKFFKGLSGRDGVAADGVATEGVERFALTKETALLGFRGMTISV